MAIIHIDGQDVEVDGADNLLQACLSLGIDIPYFCYHPALGSVGSCRQCAVKQYNNKEDYEAGRGRLVMSCMVNPTADMYISVTDDEAKAATQREGRTTAPVEGPLPLNPMLGQRAVGIMVLE